MAKLKQPKKKQKNDGALPKKKGGLGGQPSWMTNTKLHSLVIFVFSFFLYVNTLTHDYTQDDAIVIYDNMFTTQGVAGIPGILKYDTFYGFFKEAGKANLVAGGRYRPMTLVTFALEWQLFGRNPFVGHLINILLYGLVGVVLYHLLLQFFRPEKDQVYAYFVALVATLIFVAHPLHTEAVANIKGRDEIMTLLGSLLALYLSFRAYYSKKPIFAVAASIVFFLGLLSKENAITFLAIVPLSYWFFTKASVLTIVKQSGPFFIAAFAFLLIRYFVLKGQLGGELPMELMNNPYLKIEGNQYVEFTGGEKLATILFTLGKYVQLLIFPYPLTHDYYPRHVEIMTMGNWKVILSLLFYLGIGAIALFRLRKKDVISFGILFYLLTLSIVSNIVFPVGTNMSERFMFMPSVGFAIIVAVLLFRLAKKMGGTQFNFGHLTKSFGLLGLILLIFSVQTFSRNFAWKDNFTLFTTDIKTSQRSAKLCNAVGGELTTKSANEKDPLKKKKMLEEAVVHLNKALTIHPTYKNTYLLLGNAYSYQDQFEKSIEHYNKALRLDSNYKDALNNLAITHRNAGRYYGEKKGDLQKALVHLNKALEYKTNDYETLRLLGVAYGVSGNAQKAIDFFKKGTDLMPENADAWMNLGNAYHNAGQPEIGEPFRKKALQLDPDVLSKRQGGK